jgi:hypothetical protein
VLSVAQDDSEKASGAQSGPRSRTARRPHTPERRPVLARLIDAQPDFRPRAWVDELPPLDSFGTLIFRWPASCRATDRLRGGPNLRAVVVGVLRERDRYSEG